MNDTPLSPDKDLQDLALVLAVYCVRNTIIEDYHAAGKLSDPEMKAFNIEVSNKLFTALSFMLDPRFIADKEKFNALLQLYFPSDWNRPVFDPATWNLLKHPFNPSEYEKPNKKPKSKKAK